MAYPKPELFKEHSLPLYLDDKNGVKCTWRVIPDDRLTPTMRKSLKKENLLSIPDGKLAEVFMFDSEGQLQYIICRTESLPDIRDYFNIGVLTENRIPRLVT